MKPSSLLLFVCAASCLGGAALAQSGTLQFSAGAFTVAEGGTAAITVERVGGSAGRVQVDYAAYGGFVDTATTYYSGSKDTQTNASWTATSGTLVWEDGDSAPKSFNVVTLQDAVTEGNETLTLRIVEAEGGATLGLAAAKLTILDDDVPAAGALHFSTPLYFVGEGGGNALITVRRTGGSAGAVAVGYASASASLTKFAGTVALNGATPGSDYTEVSGTLTWADGDTADKSFAVPILNDTSVESLGNEVVSLTLSAPAGGAALGSATTAYLYITDNEATAHIYQVLDPVTKYMFRIGWQAMLPTVRGLLFSFPGSGGNTSGDANDNSAWRNFCSVWDFACVGGDSMIVNGFGAQRPADLPQVLDVLDLLAAACPHPEVVNAPMIFTGFSFGAITAPGIAQKLPSRTIAFGSDNGSNIVTPVVGAPSFLEALRSVPGTMVAGSADANGITTPTQMDPKFRDWRSLGLLASMPMDWNTTHQSSHGQVDGWIAHFFDQAIRLRYPAGSAPGPNPGQQPVLNTLAESNGWLGDSINVFAALGNGSTAHSPYLGIAPWADYTGDRSQADWFPSAASARLYRAFSSRQPAYQTAEPFQTPLKIIYPNELEFFSAGQPVNIIVDPRSLGGSITRLEFFDGTAKFGELTNGPWIMPLPNPGGVHGVVVVATLTDGTQQSTFQTFIVEPSAPIRIFGNGQRIVQNDASRSYNNHTLFNPGGGQNVRTYTITNPGAQTLLLTGNPSVAKSGAQQAEFTVQQPSVSSIPPGGSTTFTVTFTPGGAGLRNAALSIANSAPSAMENPFVFNIRGTDAALPDARLWLPLDETAGTTASDLSGYGTGSSIFNGTWVPAGGRTGGALSFNGTSSSIIVTSGHHLNPGDALTLAVWINPVASVNSRNVHLFNKGLTFQQYRLSYQSTGRLAFWLVGQTSGEKELVTPTPATPPINTWTHLAATYDGATMRLYQNGALIASQPFTGGPLNPTPQALFIGTTQTSDPADKWFNGLMDDVRIYGRSLSPQEVFALANPGTPDAPVSLAATAVSHQRIDLTWSNRAINETAIQIERKAEAGGVYALIDALPPGTATYSDTNLAPATAYYYRLRSTNAVGPSAYCDEASASTLTYYQNWLNTNFTPAERDNPLISGPLADPDGDGRINRTEYAQGTSPRVANTADSPAGSIVHVGGTDYLTLSFRRNRAASDVIVIVEVSDTLATPTPWSPVWASNSADQTYRVSISDNGDGTDTIVVRDNTPATTARAHRFIRLNVQ